MFFLFLGEISYTATLVNPRWNKGDVMWKKIVMFIYRTLAPVLLVSIPAFFVKPVLLTEGTDVYATKQDSLARSVKKV